MKDVSFMTAKDKELILKQWETFIKNGMQLKHFTDRLYKHLSLHCGFIAHYDINGFYHTYFDNPSGITVFFDNLFNQRYLSEDYADLLEAMRIVYTTYQSKINMDNHNEVGSKLREIEEDLKLAQVSYSFALKFLDRFNN